MTLEELKRLAEKTQARFPGPWTLTELPDSRDVDFDLSSSEGMTVATMDAVTSDARYIAAISPERVLRMLAVIEAAKAMRTPALVGNRDRVADFDVCLAELESDQ